MGREASGLRSEDKPSWKHERAQRLYSSLEWREVDSRGYYSSFNWLKSVVVDGLEIKDILYYVRKFLVFSINAD